MQMPWRTERSSRVCWRRPGRVPPSGRGAEPCSCRDGWWAPTPSGLRRCALAVGEVQVGFRQGEGRRVPYLGIDSAELDGKGVTAISAAGPARSRAELGDPRKILLGVDRLDYTRAGIDVRLKAFSELLAEGRVKRRHRAGAVGDTEPGTGGQLSHPAQRHRATGRPHQWRVREVGHPVALPVPTRSQATSRVFVASDVMLVTPLRDGMNLVAKEYVACRSDRRRRAGAQRVHRCRSRIAPGLPDQLVHLEGVKDATEAALNQTPLMKADGGCGPCAGRCWPTMSTGGPASFLDARLTPRRTTAYDRARVQSPISPITPERPLRVTAGKVNPAIDERQPGRVPGAVGHGRCSAVGAGHQRHRGP